MAYAITQTPPSLSLAESPMAFTVLETTYVTQSQFQYVMKLKYWTGSYAQEPAAFDYVLNKYPNASARGIFDVSKIVSSLFYSAEASGSQMWNFKGYFNYIYYTASTDSYVTSSTDVTSSVFQAIDGYIIFDSASYINEDASLESNVWPIMSSAPTTQSVYWCEDCGGTGDYGTLPIMRFYNLANTASYLAVDNNNVTRSWEQTFSSTNVTGSTTLAITTVPSGISNINAATASFITTNTKYYTITLKNNGVAIPTASVMFEVLDECKYKPVRIKFKNQFGQFDYVTFPKAHYEDFEVSENIYQPQLGTWEGTSLSIPSYSTLRKRYYIDTQESLSVNSDWLPQSYNEWFKQLLVSDEVYWVPNDSTIIPLVIKTKNIRFKTFVNDKLIQYTIEFLLGRSYKLIV